MKVKKLTSKIMNLAERYDLRAVTEFSTKDQARIDIAILSESNQAKLLAIEFERTYKWIRRRILYNGIKAHRSGFKNILFIYPFKKKSIPNSWVIDFLEDLGIKVKIVHPDDCIEQISNLLRTVSMVT